MNQLGFVQLILLYAWPICCSRLSFKSQQSDSFHFTDNSRHLGETCSVRLSGLSYELFSFAGVTNFIYQLSIGVSLVRMRPKRTIESFFFFFFFFYGFMKAKLSTYWKRSRSWWRRIWGVGEWDERGGGRLIKMLGGGADKKWNVQFDFLPPTGPTFYFAPPPLCMHHNAIRLHF